ncbi:MAG: DUF2780 domain-containing protein [Vicinamibacterales bacterium]
MQQFIQLVTTTLGTSEQAARQATGGLLNLLSTQAPKNDMAALLGKLPGAADLLKTFQSAPPEPTGLDALTNAASSLLGGGSSILGAGAKALGASAGSFTTLTSALSQAGMDMAKVPQFVTLFGQWATQQAGADLVQRVLSSVPGLGSVLESLGKK